MRSAKQLVLLVFTVVATVTLAQTTAPVEVTVVDADSGQAIPSAKVFLYDGENAVVNLRLNAMVDAEIIGIIRPGGRIEYPSVPPRPSRTAESNSSGKAVFAGVKTGSYRLDADAEGYISPRQQSTLSVVPTAGGIRVNVAAEDKTSVVLRLKRAGTVSGLIKDSSDAPLAGLSVYLLRPSYTPSGERLLNVVEAVTTDTEGRFAAGALNPGRYSIATGPRGTFTLSPDRRPGDSQKYAFTYYPGVQDPALAAFFDVGPGTLLNNISLTVKTQQLYRVRGQIDFGVLLPANPGFSLYSLAPFQMPGTSRRQRLQSGVFSATGSFELNGLRAGTYSLGVTANQRPLDAGPTATEDAYFTIEVKDRDIDGLIIRLSDATAIRGRVRVADGSPLNTIRTSVGRLQVGLDSIDPLQPGGFAVVDTDGSFNLKGIVGTYLVGLSVAGGAYVGEVRLNGERHTDRAITIPSGFAGEMEVVINTNGGSITGRVGDGQARPLTETTTGLLLPVTAQNASGFFREFSPRSDGTFSLGSIPPGDYRINIWDGIDRSSVFDPALLAQSRAQAAVVRVNERSEVSVSVPVIRSR